MNLQFAIDTQDRDEINQGKFGGHCSSLRQVNKADWRLNCAFVIPVGAGFGQISFFPPSIRNTLPSVRLMDLNNSVEIRI